MNANLSRFEVCTDNIKTDPSFSLSFWPSLWDANKRGNCLLSVFIFQDQKWIYHHVLYLPMIAREIFKQISNVHSQIRITTAAKEVHNILLRNIKVTTQELFQLSEVLLLVPFLFAKSCLQHDDYCTWRWATTNLTNKRLSGLSTSFHIFQLFPTNVNDSWEQLCTWAGQNRSRPKLCVGCSCQSLYGHKSGVHHLPVHIKSPHLGIEESMQKVYGAKNLYAL